MFWRKHWSNLTFLIKVLPVPSAAGSGKEKDGEDCQMQKMWWVSLHNFCQNINKSEPLKQHKQMKSSVIKENQRPKCFCVITFASTNQTSHNRLTETFGTKPRQQVDLKTAVSFSTSSLKLLLWDKCVFFICLCPNKPTNGRQLQMNTHYIHG